MLSTSVSQVYYYLLGFLTLKIKSNGLCKIGKQPMGKKLFFCLKIRADVRKHLFLRDNYTLYCNIYQLKLPLEIDGLVLNDDSVLYY